MKRREQPCEAVIIAGQVAFGNLEGVVIWELSKAIRYTRMSTRRTRRGRCVFYSGGLLVAALTGFVAPALSAPLGDAAQLDATRKAGIGHRGELREVGMTNVSSVELFAHESQASTVSEIKHEFAARRPVLDKSSSRGSILGDDVKEMLQSWRYRGGQAPRVRVIVSLHDNYDVPRFPEAIGSSRNSRRGRGLLRQAQRLADTMIERRSDAYDTFERQIEQRDLGTEVRRFWLIQAVVLETSLDSIRSIAGMSAVEKIELSQSNEAPPGNRISDGRQIIGTDHWRSFSSDRAWIALLDTGVWTHHRLLSSPDVINWRRDCVNGTGRTCRGNSKTDPNDIAKWNHGTATASILVGNDAMGDRNRGVTDNIVDSFKVYNNNGYNREAGVLAFQAAVLALDKVIVAEIQAKNESGDDSTARAADAAYDAGAVVIAAAGNYHQLDPPRLASPGTARKALAVGGIDILRNRLIPRSNRGRTDDERVIPSICAPTRTYAASMSGHFALQLFTGTSGATPYVAAAAALMRERLRDYEGSIDPGQIYAYLIMAGRETEVSNQRGAGMLELPLGKSHWGRIIIREGEEVEIPIPFDSWVGEYIRGAIWWPEESGQKSDIDLKLITPDGGVWDTSRRLGSVYEKVGTDSADHVRSGTWKLRIIGYKLDGVQTVYYAAGSGVRQ